MPCLNALSLMMICLSLTTLNVAEASTPIQVGDQVLVRGQFNRKCSARVLSLSEDAKAKLEFDRAGCGDQAKPYEAKAIQRLTFVEKTKTGSSSFQAGDKVTLKGYFAAVCSATVKSVSRSGYAQLNLDSSLCADGAALHKVSDLQKVNFVSEAEANSNRFRIGQTVTAPGILASEKCSAKIVNLTDSGLAVLAFTDMTCGASARLHSLETLSPSRQPSSVRRLTGERIFQQVMKEIAAAKRNNQR